MLELRPNCECCDRDLPPESRDAVICTFECTFCASCASDCSAASARIAGANSFAARSGPPTSFHASLHRRSACSRRMAARRRKPHDEVSSR